DVGDYATNEPTMDGTAALVPVLTALEQQGKSYRAEKFVWQHGAIVRGDIALKQLALVFTGDEFADGGKVILETLQRHRVPGSFFLTGKFYHNPDFQPLIEKLKNAGFYLGPHSDQHLLYAPWENRKTLLVTESEFKQDLAANYAIMSELGISRDSARYFLPPYEWYNEQIAAWTREMGLSLVNYSFGTLSHADYTVPSMGNGYRSSAKIMHSILDYEKNETAGFNGFILLSHIGSHPDRTDKFYRHLDELITTLKARGYIFVRIDTLLK
ncbi:polysaccharide deacetylase family protein, partial [bacterium]|nr:polysaccharide deacetylase family protein [bacterium]